MQGADLARVVTAAVAPVVIISACGLLALAFYNRLAAIVSRLRVQRERLLELERMENGTSKHGQRLLDHLEFQTVRVRRRANFIRLTLGFLLLTVGLLVGCCLLQGLSVLFPKAEVAAVVLFYVGLISMLASVIAAALELKGALEPVELESQFVSQTLREHASLDADAG